MYDNLVRPFFARTRTKLAVMGIAATNVGFIATSLGYNDFVRVATNHLTSKSVTEFPKDVAVYGALAFGIASINVARNYLTQRFSISWQDWTCQQLTKKWCSEEARQRFLSKSHKEDAHPDQRLTNDTWGFVEFSTQLAIGSTSSLISGLSFYAVLFQISPTLGTAAGLINFLGLVSTEYVGRKTSENIKILNALGTELRQAAQETERTKNETALYGSEEVAQENLIRKRRAVSRAARRLNIEQNCLMAITSIIDKIAYLTPFLLLTPKYLATSNPITYGEMTQASSAYLNASGELGWFARSKFQRAQWISSVKNLTHFLSSLDGSSAPEDFVRPSYTADGHAELRVENLGFSKPGGQVLCQDASFELRAGDRLVITGAQGCGKSTLMRILAGLYPATTGTIAFTGMQRKPGEMIFVPQAPYVPKGSLRDVLSFPRTGHPFSDECMMQALKDVGLHGLAATLERNDPNEQSPHKNLSGGEQQQLIFARLLLHKPRFIGLDEAGSSLPHNTSVDLHRILFEKLPDSIIISIVHQNDDLVAMHTHRAVCEDGRIHVQARSTEALRQPEPVRSTPSHGAHNAEALRRMAPMV